MNTETLNNHRMGLRDSFPIAFGYVAVSFAFGILAASYGFSISEAVIISMFNMTSAGQLAGQYANASSTYYLAVVVESATGELSPVVKMTVEVPASAE